MSESVALDAYLIPGRLADVLTLIQVLAYDPSARRSDEGLTKQLFRIPRTAQTWAELAKQHPEFFRVLDPKQDPEKKESIALVARFVLPAVLGADGSQARTPVLNADVTNNLMCLAIELHDRGVQHRDRWKTVLVPMVVAIIAAGASIIAAVISVSKPPMATATQPRTAGDAPQAPRP
jgi:hypothetical protein